MLDEKQNCPPIGKVLAREGRYWLRIKRSMAELGPKDDGEMGFAGWVAKTGEALMLVSDTDTEDRDVVAAMMALIISLLETDGFQRAILKTKTVRRPDVFKAHGFIHSPEAADQIGDLEPHEQVWIYQRGIGEKIATSTSAVLAV